MMETREMTRVHEPLDWNALEAALDILCPMHLRVTETGHILHAGPTIQKLRSGFPLQGARFLEVFRLDRPRSITNMHELLSRARSKLHLQMRDSPHTGLKGVLVRLPRGQGAIINLSFGISVVEGVQDYGLSSADFAATDLAIEMLYLVEAKSAAMDASRKLNQKLQGAKVAAEVQAFTDALTGLNNRRAADRHLAQAVEDKHPFALMHVDLDYFKAVNDTMGHAAGDHVLHEVAQVMRAETRDSDMIARVGGDEFMIMICGDSPTQQIKAIAERLIKGIEKPIPFEEQVCRISASIGIAQYHPSSLLAVEELVQHSDRALYASKDKGRACVTFYENL